MKKLYLGLLLLICSGTAYGIKINLKPGTSHYPLAVTFYQSQDDNHPLTQYFIKKDQKLTTITLSDLLLEIDDQAAKTALRKSNKIFMEIKISTSDDLTSPNITLYSNDIALDANINVVTASFGMYQAIGALQITNKNMYEPDRDAYKYVEKLAQKK